METEQVTHRPGNLKQQNKKHKHGQHRSKGSIHKINKGRVPVKVATKANRLIYKKEERRNQIAQLRHRKRTELLNRRNLLDAPHLVAVVALNENVQYDKVFEQLESADNEAVVRHTSENHTHISVPRFNKRFTFVRIDRRELFSVLDVLKTADTVLFVVSVLGIDDWSDVLLTAIMAQGLPTYAVCLVGLELVLPKKRQESKSQIQKAVNHWFPDEKINVLEKEGDALNLLRRIGHQKQRIVKYRNRYPYVLGETVTFTKTDETGKGVLKVTGYLRGQPLNVNSLVHIPGWGDFQMTQIDAPNDVNYVNFKSRKDVDMVNEHDEVKVLQVAVPSLQDSLDSENIADPMDAEQTWPTEEELKEADEARTTKKIKKVPKGMSEYEAAWIPDSDGEDVTDDSDEDSHPDEMEMAEEDESEEEDAQSEMLETMTVSEVPVEDEQYDKELNPDEEEDALKKLKEARENQMFPDEVDTPANIPARERFQRYRGLKSFRTSPWDPKEDLPANYARIFKFQNFSRTAKRLIQLQEDVDGACPGWYITVHVKNVPEEFYETREQPVALFGMLPHEQKMSLVNMVLKRPNISLQGPQKPIKSKEPMVFQCGYRRFKACPIFSQHTNGTKHKYERYFQPEGNIVASVYAQIMFPPSSVLAFQETRDGMPLVATGSLLSVDPNRLIIKRAVLSGHPFKVHKRSAVIRFMFFNREDISWFKPVELRTKYGRRGHIKEPLGTHGHMKCVFDGQLKSQDTILLNLYKRVYPKWTYEPYTSTNLSIPMD